MASVLLIGASALMRIEKRRNFFASTGIPALDNRGTDSADDIPLMSMVRV